MFDGKANAKFSLPEIKNLPDRSKFYLESPGLGQAGSDEKEVVDVDPDKYNAILGLAEIKAVFTLNVSEAESNHTFVPHLVPNTKSLWETLLHFPDLIYLPLFFRTFWLLHAYFLS
jgi:hypothetical protein